MSSGPGPGGKRPDVQQTIASALSEVTDRATVLVREEIELAKAEVTQKVTKLARGAVVGVVAGVFFAMAVVMALFGFAYLLFYFLPGNDYTVFWGFFAMAVILLVLGALAGLIAAKAVKRGAPPVPTMAIAEAQKIREAVTAGPGEPEFRAAPATAPAAAPPAPAPPPPPPAPPAPESAPEEPPAPEPPAEPETTEHEQPAQEEPPAGGGDE